jgi:hypothetical protein
MKKRHVLGDLSEAERDACTIADVDDPSAWGDPEEVPPSKSAKPSWVVAARSAAAKAPTDRVDVESSVIARIGYNASSATLHVEFKSGRLYQYFNVPVRVYESLKNAASVGSYFNNRIRPKYECAEIVFDRRVG